MLQDQEDAKLIYITGIHAVACYIRNERGHLKCVLVDSEGGDTDLALYILTGLQKQFPRITFYISTTRLQKDYYSCTTFAFKALLYFVKHGSEVFPWLEQKEFKQCKKDPRIVHLSSSDLMPVLFKMTQDFSVLSDSAFASLASHKRQTSLRDYINQHLLELHGKQVNSAALVKKYKCFSLLERYITRIIGHDHINPEPGTDLPSPLFHRHRLYSSLTGRISSSIKLEQSLIDACQDIVNFLENKAAPEPSPALQKTLNEIQKKFPSFVQDYQKLFPHNVFYTSYLESNYKDLTRLRKLLYIAALFETNDSAHIKIYKQFAKKLTKLFTSADQAVMYLRKYSTPTSRQPIHDACLFRIPIAGDGAWDNGYWAQLVMDFGEQALKYLPWAARLDRLRKEQANILERHAFVTPLEQFDYLMQHYTYPRSHENPVLAELCRTHMLPEQEFNRCLELSQYNKPFDLLPDVFIRGEELGAFLRGYYLRKLPAGDEIGYLLGEYTACCQTLGKQGESCAIHGMHSLMSGFYVIYNQQHQIVAQFWAWIGTCGELVLDSFERSHSNKNFLCKPFATALAERCVQQGFSKVLIGYGNTPKMDVSPCLHPAKAYDPCSYSDASMCQFIILEADYHPELKLFQAYTSHNGLSFAKFEHLFTPVFFETIFAKGLIELVEHNRLTFDELFKLICFCYRGIYDFLHDPHSDNEVLLKLLFEKFGLSMAPLLMLKNKAQEALIDVIIKREDMDLLTIAIEVTQKTNATPLISSSLNAPLYRIAHSAAKYNSIRTLQVLHERYFDVLSWDEYITLPDYNGLTVLSQAAVSEQHTLVQAIISQVTDNRRLHELLKKEHGTITRVQDFTETPARIRYEGYRCAILHYLAAKNDIETFKLIESRIDSQALCELLDQKAQIPNWHENLWSLPVSVYAWIRQSFDFAHYIMTNYYPKPNLSNLLVSRSSSDNKKNILGLVIANNNQEQWNFLRSVHVDEAHWIDTLLKDIRGYEVSWDNPLGEMMRTGSLDCAYAVLHNIQNFECFHRIMAHKNAALLVFLQLAEPHYGKKPFIDLVSLILQRYSEHPESLSEVFDLKISAIVLKQRNLNLFEQLLTLISQDPALFVKWIKQEYFENVLHYIFAEFEDKTGKKPDFIQDMVPFVDALFQRCTPEHIKTLLSLWSSMCTWESTFSSITIPLFDYILKTVKNIDDSQYLKTWFSLENPALHSLFKNKQESFALTDCLLECYIEHHGAEQVADYFMKNEIKFLWDFVSRYHNIRLLQYLYPLTKSDTRLYASLLTILLNENWQISPAATWLMEQPEITANHLFKYINHFNEHQPNASAYVHLYVITHLWNIGVRKGMSHELAITTMQRHFIEVLQKLLLCLSNPAWQNPIDLNYIKTFKILFYSWLDHLAVDKKSVFELVSTPGPDGNNAFFSLCSSNRIDLVKIVLLRCQPEQRTRLLDMVQAQASEKEQAILPELTNLVQHYQRLDEMLALRKNEIPRISGTSLTFFSAPPNSVAERLDPEQWIRYDADGELNIISPEEIDHLTRTFRG
ncbi:hypothetical protein ELY21_13805 [Legionella sp. km535]|uniref:hypothetical protein n=1 Tax=Legionella sp. km535 TaxID=2498107 RepID=UPI000F8F3BB4|nr:hypothetical protein [Legionella sp. km535]RUR16035.1 hypothetical protein ELY21_13805 [Legionella sp. km535]